jgi:serine/threonine protein kinase
MLKSLVGLKGLSNSLAKMFKSSEKKPLSQQKYILLDPRYEIIENIGSGGMSDVYTAYDLLIPTYSGKDNLKAIKVLNPKFSDCDEAIYSLESEYIIGQKLTHKSLVKCYNFVSNDKNSFLVMEFLKGKTLNQLKREIVGLWSNDQKINLLRKLSESLAYTHANFVVHGDLKPSNIFICNNGILKLIDFGLSSSPNRRPPNTSYGFSLKFASPERILGSEPSNADDLYAFGCVAHIVLTGKHPFGNISSLEASNLNLMPQQISGIDRKTQIIINATLSFDPVTRANNAQELYSFFKNL